MFELFSDNSLKRKKNILVKLSGAKSQWGIGVWSKQVM